jgi:hypothetical protein
MQKKPQSTFTTQIGASVLAVPAMLTVFAASMTTASATPYIDDVVGVLNGNAKAVFEATGNTVTSTTFATDIATAFANNTGGVWDFDGAAFNVVSGETITLNYGASLSKQLVLTLNEGSGAAGINQANNAGEPTSGSFELGFGGSGATRTFVSSTPLLEVGIFNSDRNDSSRIPVLTVFFQDNTSASTSGANADNVFFHGLSGTLANPIVSFSLSQNNFIRYDDLGFVTASVPEPTTIVTLLGGIGMLAFRRRRSAGRRG